MPCGDIQQGNIDNKHQIQHDGVSAKSCIDPISSIHTEVLYQLCVVINTRSIIKALLWPLIQLYSNKFNEGAWKKKTSVQETWQVSLHVDIHTWNVRYTTHIPHTSVKWHMVQVATTDTTPYLLFAAFHHYFTRNKLLMFYDMEWWVSHSLVLLLTRGPLFTARTNKALWNVLFLYNTCLTILGRMKDLPVSLLIFTVHTRDNRMLGWSELHVKVLKHHSQSNNIGLLLSIGRYSTFNKTHLRQNNESRTALHCLNDLTDLYEMVLWIMRGFGQGLMGNVIFLGSAFLPPGMNQCQAYPSHEATQLQFCVI